MNKLLLFWSLLCITLVVKGQDAWKIVPGTLTTSWAADVNPDNPLPEYPRPQLVRDAWTSLNGSWQYAIVAKDQGDHPPATFEGAILVPYAVESGLSGVGKRVGKDQVLWYKRNFRVPKKNKGEALLLHFGAVDWACAVYVNGRQVGSHEGGYDPFTFDITDALQKGSEQEITVKVWDPTDDGPQPRGKQVKNPGGIWYTPVTGIWQTVWLEVVPTTFISSTRHTPDVDQKQVLFDVNVVQPQEGDLVRIAVYSQGKQLSEQTASANSSQLVKLDNPHLWSPDDPFLYDVTISLLRKGKLIDEAKSYFAMRKISLEKDENGILRMMLNNRFVFQYGPLDQGWWPDGLYTAPTDEALAFDILKTKEMGFNMIRKHVKVEPARWYYHCDKAGMLVWQDMPSGDLGARWGNHPGIYGPGRDMDRSAASEAIYRKEWKAIMSSLYNFPSIVVWVPFNEAWGQFKTKEIVEWTKQMDPSRLVNPASGGNFHPTGDLIDLHNYPQPAMPRADLFGKDYALVLGEFGGLGLPLEGHTWQQKDNWGYQSFKNKEELLQRYTTFMHLFPELIREGLSAAVYTQTTDVEVETNGLMTYDRKVIKMPAATLKSLHDPLYKVVQFEKNTSSSN